ncbi:MAG: DUF1415 domain-containing protein [Halieaceae bacterium]|nr:DUF1415 domain-containing protein [Halieaceae bacterium]
MTERGCSENTRSSLITGKEAGIIKNSIITTQRWIQSFVVELNLCPFAQHVTARDVIRYTACAKESLQDILHALHEEMDWLDSDPETETSFLILTSGMKDFSDFNDCLAMAQELLVMMNWVGRYQLVGFHPHHQFDGTDPDDAENYTNRSPYPMVHILRESSVTQAVDATANIALIPKRNTDTLNQLGVEVLIKRWQDCF